MGKKAIQKELEKTQKFGIGWSQAPEELEPKDAGLVVAEDD
jgi:hypothetical protein